MTRTYKDIEYALVRSRRKTASIYIERDGKVSVLVPENLTDPADRRPAGEQAEVDLPESRRVAGLERREGRAGLRQRRRLPVPGPVVPPEAGSRTGRAADAEGRVLLPARRRTGPAPDADAAFKAFYREKGAARIPPRVAYYQAKMDVEPKSVKVIDLKHRWASCTPGDRGPPLGKLAKQARDQQGRSPTRFAVSWPIWA